MSIDVPSLILGASTPFLVVFTIRAIKLVPGVLVDTFLALWSLVKIKTPKIKLEA